MSARAKHFGRQFISENQRFTTEMLRPYEYICKNEMHPDRFLAIGSAQYIQPKLNMSFSYFNLSKTIELLFG